MEGRGGEDRREKREGQHTRERTGMGEEGQNMKGRGERGKDRNMKGRGKGKDKS